MLFRGKYFHGEVQPLIVSLPLKMFPLLMGEAVGGEFQNGTASAI